MHNIRVTAESTIGDSTATEVPEAVAIVGMSLRFPGASTPEQYWTNLRMGVESIRASSETELLEGGVAPDLVQRPDFVRSLGVLEDIAGFDARFFGFSPREADILDPQQRIFLECAWEALERAGYAPNAANLVGVYAGVGSPSYLLRMIASPAVRERFALWDLLLANEKDHFTTRVGYKLNLRGPCVTVQTTCSTSLVSVVLAVQGLLTYHCDLALAGGSSLQLTTAGGYVFQEGHILSPDGHCRAFDAAAAGTVPSSGAGVVVLKRLSEAVADGDRIYAVIRGAAINNDGAAKIGFTAPSVDGQSDVILTAHAQADVSPDDISYIETHGTGTVLGDPIEIAALTRAFRAGTDRRNFCAIGSVKTNFGHLDAAAGVAGLIKTTLALHHQEIPPSLHFTTPNPELGLEESPFFVNTELRPWPAGDRPRLAGVSSFGIGGTNAHVVLEEAPVGRPVIPATRPSQLLVLSAATSSALEQAAANLGTHLAAHPEQQLDEVAYTLQVGRVPQAHRRALVSGTTADAIQALRDQDSRQLAAGEADTSDRPVAFLFSGQGGQHIGMARELYVHEPVFRAVLDRCSLLLESHLGLDLRNVIYAEADDMPQAEHVLDRMDVAQPAVFAIEYALAQWWLSIGVQPQALLGHSLGEFAAACVAGVFSLEDALGLVAVRGRLMQSTPDGMMLAVALSEAELMPLLGDELAVAAVNSSRLCVAAGPLAAGEMLESRLQQQSIASWRLRVSRASHSPMMDAVLDQFRAAVAGVPLSAPRIPFISNVTGTWITTEQATDPRYWASHLRSTARFADGLDVLVAQPDYALLEVGPGQSLTRLAAHHPARQTKQVAVASLPHPADKQSDLDTLLTAVGQLWVAGRAIDWTGLHPNGGRRVVLPTYPFERQRHWIDVNDPGQTPVRQANQRTDPTDWLYAPAWRRTGQGDGRAAAALAAGPAQQWLVLCDELGWGERLRHELERAGQRVIRVYAGTGFERLDQDSYRIDPRRPEAYGQLLDELRAAGVIPNRVLHLWSLSGNPAEHGGSAPDRSALDLGFYSLLFLGQALGEQPEATAMEVTAISNGLHVVVGDELVQPEKAALLGPCRVMPKEFPQQHWRSIDIGSTAVTDATGTGLVEHLLDELTSAPRADEPVLAYRAGYRWTQTYGPVRDQAGSTARQLRELGVYLITGGLGGVGLALAEYLARTVHARLALVGRSAFPQRAAWPMWLETHAADDPTSSRIRQIQGIESNGGEVYIEQADITDPETAVALINRVKQHFGGLHGIIHAAGTLDDGIVSLKTAHAAQRVLAPKVEGTFALAAAVRDEPLDFVVLCSSISAITGPAGQVDYCTANAVMDAFANGRAARGDRQLVSINWDAWADAGMWARTLAEARRKAPHVEIVAEGLRNEEGAQALVRALALGLPQVVISTRDFAALLNLATSSTETPQPTDATQTPHSTVLKFHSRPTVSTAYEPPRNDLEARLVAIWREVLGIDQIGINDNFFELGGDSIVSIQLVARAKEAGLRMTSKQVFLHPTVAEFAETLNPAAPAVPAGSDMAQVPLTPIGHWFFDQQPEDAHHFNQSFLLEERRPLDPALLERALAGLVDHHAALRLRYLRENGEVRQVLRGPGEAPGRFEVVDLANLAPAERQEAVEAHAATLQASLNLADGPLLTAAHFRFGGDQPGQLLIVAHHLVIDGVSWRILLEDLQTAYQQLSVGEPVVLAQPVTSFQQWSHYLDAYAASPELHRELDYWLAQSAAELPALPLEGTGERNTEADVAVATAELTADETHAVLREVPRAHRARINAVLLTAVARAFAGWTGRTELIVDLEGHGREPIAEGIDLSRTVGWFTTMFPLRLDLADTRSAVESLSAIREQLKRLPVQGIGFGVLRYLAAETPRILELRRQASSPVSFNYLGQFDQTLPNTGALQFTDYSSGPAHSPRQRRPHVIDIVCLVMAGRLRLQCVYGQQLHSGATMQRLVDGIAGQLRELIAASPSARRPAADFPLAGLDSERMAALLRQIDRRPEQNR